MNGELEPPDFTTATEHWMWCTVGMYPSLVRTADGHRKPMPDVRGIYPTQQAAEEAAESGRQWIRDNRPDLTYVWGVARVQIVDGLR